MNEPITNITDCYMTIKRLKEAIEDLPDDGKIFYERIEDSYFEKHGWSSGETYRQKPSCDWPGEFDEFTMVWCHIRYKEKDGNLYLTAHY